MIAVAAIASLSLFGATASVAEAQSARWEFATAGEGVEAFAGYDGFPNFNMAFSCVAPGARIDARDADAPIANRSGTYNIFIGRDGFLGEPIADGRSVRVRFEVDGRRVDTVTFTALDDRGDLLGVADADGALVDAVRAGGRLEAAAIGFDGYGEAPLRGSARALTQLAAFCPAATEPEEEDEDDRPSLRDLLLGDRAPTPEPAIPTPPIYDDADGSVGDRLYLGDLASGDLAPGGLARGTIILTNRFGQSVRDDPTLDFRTGLARYSWSRGRRTLEIFFARESRDRIVVNGEFRTARGDVVPFSEVMTRRRGGFFRMARDIDIGRRDPLFLQIELE